jgi:ankyrin repeat protein
MQPKALFGIGILCSIQLAWAAENSPGRIRDAAARSLAIFQASQKNWYALQTCVSCHHQFQAALAFRSAREHDIPVDEVIARADAIKAFNYTDLDAAVQYSYVVEPAMGDAYKMLAADAVGVRPNLVAAVYARVIASRQGPDGDWNGYHQRPPSSYSSFTQTALVVRALQLYSHPSQKADVTARTGRARAWLLSHTPPDTEGRTYQLLGLFWSGADPAAIRKSAQALADTQQADGGWNSLDGRDSDAYSTGEALVALAEAGKMPVEDVRYRRGIDYLLKTQMPDGSWHVGTRLHPPARLSPPYFETGYPYGHEQFISAQGSLWAVMALARALGPARQVEAPPLKEAEPSQLPSWAETVLFGTAADLKKLLDHGFDPNSATRRGGTTALMMAAPDVQKMKMLLDHGANVNARAQSKYSALMVAAQYGDSSPAIRLILDHGAQVQLPGGESVLFDANPMFLAAYAGNAAILPDLHQAGCGLDDRMNPKGTHATTPLNSSVVLGNLDVIKTLLDIGGVVEEQESSGVTLLGRAVLNNQVAIARLLIARGANVNHVDGLGMTPLLYAASIDFGDAAMIELLLKSGARADARTKQGFDALDLARKYKHTHLIATLEAAQRDQ